MNDGETVGLILGDGSLAQRVAYYALQRFATANVFLTKDAYRSFCRNHSGTNSVHISITQPKKILEFLKTNSCSKVTMIGSVPRPSLFSLTFSDTEFKKLLKEVNDNGDSYVGKLLIEFFESKGFRVIGVQELTPELVIPEGFHFGQFDLIQQECFRGIALLRVLAYFDCCQSVAVKNNNIITIEDRFGTDALIERVRSMKVEGAVLIKMRNPRQDIRFDLPVVGSSTIKNLARAKFKGLIVESSFTLTED
ncbi:MAG: UDP-2,3-diacylglucosamine diphosphatase LpxI, partial [Deltaproteobacteria bacterium]|nr:UDP-2,3-diacylglucosamine diphosphatase LpxI [Deltaproteobacteria bacterium]